MTIVHRSFWSNQRGNPKTAVVDSQYVAFFVSRSFSTASPSFDSASSHRFTFILSDYPFSATAIAPPPLLKNRRSLVLVTSGPLQNVILNLQIPDRVEMKSNFRTSVFHISVPTSTQWFEEIHRRMERQRMPLLGYSYVWWDWETWEKEIDGWHFKELTSLLHLQGKKPFGIKFLCHFSNHMDFNISAQDLNNFFGGPAFLAWATMGNLHTWGGPLSQNWLDQQLVLQKQIISQMIDLGMTPVQPFIFWKCTCGT
ncbi:hypothetical protein L1887_07311 [Cichorium endivia]|nr:hypothetical protein L1887_07311 [Cichorium endivia]